MKEHTLTRGNVGRGILLFVLPIIAGSLIQQLYVTIDAIIVGQFTGTLGLAAIDSVHTLFEFYERTGNRCDYYDIRSLRFRR